MATPSLNSKTQKDVSRGFETDADISLDTLHEMSMALADGHNEEVRELIKQLFKRWGRTRLLHKVMQQPDGYRDVLEEMEKMGISKHSRLIDSGDDE